MKGKVKQELRKALIFLKSIPNESNHLDKSETSLKFPLGPIISPSPGPTLEIEVAAPETADRKSIPEIDKNIDKIKNRNK